MKLNQRALLCLIIAGFLTQSIQTPTAFGQNDELDRLFEDEELDEPVGNFNQAPPPPPPPPSDFGNMNPDPSDFGAPPEPDNGGRSFPTVQGGAAGPKGAVKPLKTEGRRTE